jgi:YD repeat-containing protein
MTRDGVTQTRTFAYDTPTGRLTSRTLPESGTTTYAYNAQGQLASQTDARGYKIDYTYDDKARVTLTRRLRPDQTEEGRTEFTFTQARIASSRTTSGPCLLLARESRRFITGESGAYRVIYCARRVEAVYVLHAFRKKTQATSKRDVGTARRRFAQLNRGVE